MTKIFEEMFNELNKFDKYFIGLDNWSKRTTDTLKTLSNLAQVNWPPYNIRKIDENKYCIEIAAAGFGRQDLEVELDGDQLLIKGKATVDNHPKDEKGDYYLYKGVADRQFVRVFTLADTVIINNCEYINGMLRVYLDNIIPDSKKKKIDIKEAVATEQERIDSGN